MDHLLGGPAHRAAVLEGEKTQSVQVFALDLHGVKDDVVLDGLVQKQAHALAVLRPHGDAGPQRVARVASLRGSPKRVTLPCVSYRLITPFGMPSLPWPARPAIPRTSPSYTSSDTPRTSSPGISTCRSRMLMATLPCGGVRGAASTMLSPFRPIMSSAKFHNACLCFFARGGQLAVAQYRNRISGGHHLVQTMGDKDDGDAVRSNLFHHGDQLRGLALGQHRRGLVKHKQLYAGLVNFAGDSTNCI